ncbi:PIN domain-containing protein [Spirulina major CS-329]|uniref:PIN domain-containing protein n=1 Tax=Spirulina TaxID=1154 RepID=UPI00232F895F|nr:MULTISPECIES: PIN domain-containing protein [Spirulina]MDB9493257.1 PIN domain-containing protein [Spirulina subsalsa CS-330]MDB9505294.1 PIN domain-containing protein [Spirulina major CS-329]
MSDEYLAQLCSRYLQKGILVDSNILLLWVVGRLNPNRIETFKRTRDFTVEDFELLNQLLAKFTKVITTPHILTEVYNLANQLNSRDREGFLFCLSQLISSTFNEQQVPAKQLIQNPKFTTFGVTDCGIMKVAAGRFLVLTDDFKLASYLTAIGIDMLNFNHLRFRT